MKTTIYKFFYAAVLVLGLCACENQLDIEKHGTMNFDTYYQTDQEAESAVAAIYFQHRDIEFYYYDKFIVMQSSHRIQFATY